MAPEQGPTQQISTKFLCGQHLLGLAFKLHTPVLATGFNRSRVLMIPVKSKFTSHTFGNRMMTKFDLKVSLFVSVVVCYYFVYALLTEQKTVLANFVLIIFNGTV